MEWEPSERDAWVADAQRWISQIKGVLESKIDLDSAGEITGIHVVAGMEREPRHIVRDVESLLKARLQMDVYYKKIGVVQVMGNSVAVEAAAALADENESSVADVPGSSSVSFHPPGSEADDESLLGLEWEEQPATAVGTLPSPENISGPEADALGEPEPIPAVLVAEGLTPRITCGGVGVMASDMVVRAEVHLRAGEVEARGKREGPNHAESDLQLVARATLDAVSELLVDPVLLHLNEVRVENLGGQTAVITAVDLVEGRISETLFGACSTRHNRQQAVVHSVLDAMNRRLSLYSLKSAPQS